MKDPWSLPHWSACLSLLLQLEDKAGTEQMARSPPWDSRRELFSKTNRQSHPSIKLMDLGFIFVNILSLL